MLLDAINLPFVHPPRGVPIASYDTPESPVAEARVCDECYDQLYGTKTPRNSPRLPTAEPTAVTTARRRKGRRDTDGASVVSRASSSGSSGASSVVTPRDGCPPNGVLSGRPAIRRARTSSYPSPRLPPSPLRSNSVAESTSTSSSSSSKLAKSPAHSVVGAYAPYTSPPQQFSGPAAAAAALLADDDDAASLGELAAYPLRRPSSVCKALGGGRWVPKTIVVRVVGQRGAGVMGSMEIEQEIQKEREVKRRRGATPIVRDGDIMVREPYELEPCSPGGPYKLATF